MNDWQSHTFGTDLLSEESRQTLEESNGYTWSYEEAFKAEQLLNPMIANHAINSTPVVHHHNPHADLHTPTDFDTSIEDNQLVKSPEGSSKMQDSPPPLQLILKKANSVKSVYPLKDNAYKVKCVFLLNLIDWDSLTAIKEASLEDVRLDMNTVIKHK